MSPPPQLIYCTPEVGDHMLRHIQQAKSQPQTGMSFVHLGMLAVSTMTLRNNLDTEKGENTLGGQGLR